MEERKKGISPLAGTIWAYPNVGFWIVHVIGVIIVGYAGYYLLGGMR